MPMAGPSSWDQQISRLRFLSTGWLERSAFGLARALALPGWLGWSLARPDPQPLGYADLLAIAGQWPRSPVPSGAAEIANQQKWARRAARLVALYGLKKTLEIGCGAGFVAADLRRRGIDSWATDIQDNLAADVRRSQLPFVQADASGHLPFAGGQFDLVYSINALEHIPQPPAALQEMLRILRPGGLLFFSFDPIYNSPWGLHANRRLGMPYPQLLFTPADIQRYLDEHRALLEPTYSPTSSTATIGPFLNGYSLKEYRALLARYSRQMQMLLYVERVALPPWRFMWQHARRLKARVAHFDELTISGVKLVARKRA